MKQVIIFILIIQTSLPGRTQEIDWATTHNWKIYALNNKEAYYYSADTLMNFKSVRMNDSAVISFLSNSVVWPSGKSGTWMGVYIASYENADKQFRKVVLSSYGGFLFESKSRRYYELPRNLRQSWNDFIVENLKNVFEE
ncbi:MAG: hypothetical protein ABI675_02925 [Chitinophagaceae bacterium]